MTRTFSSATDSSSSSTSSATVRPLKAAPAVPPIPNQSSSIEEVKAWISWFATSKLRASKEQLQRLQDAFSYDGDILLAITESQCERYCKEEALPPSWGGTLYNSLHGAPTSSAEFIELAHRFAPDLLRTDRQENTLVLATSYTSGQKGFSRLLAETLFDREQSFAEVCKRVLRYHEFVASQATEEASRALPLILMPGSPGVGKTRMLMEIAKQWRDQLRTRNIGDAALHDAVRIVVSYNSGYETLVPTPDGAGDLLLRILFVYLYGHQSAKWPAFISRMQPHLSLLDARSLVDFICGDSGKKTIFLGIDESLRAESIFQSFIQDIIQLIRSNTPARVIPIASSLSLERIAQYWCYNNKSSSNELATSSGRVLATIPLPSIDADRLIASAPTDFFECFNDREKETINDALLFTGGHPRSMAIVLAEVEAKRNMRVSSANSDHEGCHNSAAAAAAAPFATFDSLCHDIVSQACKGAESMFGKSRELMILCAICAKLPAEQKIDNHSLTRIRQFDGFRFDSDDDEKNPPETYRCGVVPAVLYDLAERSKHQDTSLTLLSKLLDAARRSNSPGRFESFLHAYFTLAWGQRSRDTLRSAFPCLTVDTPLRPIVQHCTVDNRKLGSALKFEHGQLVVIDSEEGGVVSAGPTSIHFSGTGNSAQPGFDILMFQPQTNDSAAVLVLIEAKYSGDGAITTKLVPQDVMSKVEQCVIQLAPFLPDMDNLFGSYSIRNGVPYEPKTAEELIALKNEEAKKMKKKKVAKPKEKKKMMKAAKPEEEEEKKIVYVPFEDLAAIPKQAASSKQFAVEPNNIYLVCASYQASTISINNKLSKHNGKVGVLRVADLRNLVGPMWRQFPLLRRTDGEDVTDAATSVTPSLSAEVA